MHTPKTTLEIVFNHIFNFILLPLTITSFNLIYFFQIFQAGRDYEAYWDLKALGTRDLYLVLNSIFKGDRYVYILLFWIFQLLVLHIAGQTQDKEKTRLINFKSISTSMFVLPLFLILALIIISSVTSSITVKI